MRLLTHGGVDTTRFWPASDRIRAAPAQRDSSAAPVRTLRGGGAHGVDDRARLDGGGSAGGWRAWARAFVLALVLVLASAGCAVPAARPATPAAAPEQPAHRIWVVHHGYHSGIVVRAADVAPQAWPARRDFPQAEFLEVGWGDREYYMAPAPGLWSGLRALLWPTPAVLHVVAFDGPVERYFAEFGVVELKLSPSGFAALVDAVSDSHARGPEAAGVGTLAQGPQLVGPGLYGVSHFYASRERFHLFRTCNVWIAELLSTAGVPLRPRTVLTANALFTQLRPHGHILREPP